MKSFSDINFEFWFERRMKPWEVSASVNPAFKYEIEKETEKAICFRIKDPKQVLKQGFAMWAPKSAIISM